MRDCTRGHRGTRKWEAKEPSAIVHHPDRHEKYKHSYYYWAPLLAYYSACRIEEICQLHTDNIKQENGTWVLDINGNDGRKLKTLSSKRLIPIHSHLIELGFLEFVGKPKRKLVFRELIKAISGFRKGCKCLICLYYEASR